MADWEKIIGTVNNVFTAGSNIYATTVIAQAKVGLFDAQKKTLNTQISILKDNELAKIETAENTKKANQIKNKIMYRDYITEDEYDFLVGLGYDIGMSYKQYIDYISTDYSTLQVANEQSQVSKNSNSNLKSYLLLAGLGIGTYLIFRKR